MAYTIRYGKNRSPLQTIKQTMVLQTVISGILLAGIGLLRLLEMPQDAVSRILTPQMTSVTEKAVLAASQTLVAGEGWYASAVVWCRTVLNLLSG